MKHVFQWFETFTQETPGVPAEGNAPQGIGDAPAWCRELSPVRPDLHGIDDIGVDIVFALPQLPSATQGFVGCHEIGYDLATRGCKRILLL